MAQMSSWPGETHCYGQTQARPLGPELAFKSVRCHQRIPDSELWEIQGEGQSVSTWEDRGGCAEEGRDHEGLEAQAGCQQRDKRQAGWRAGWRDCLRTSGKGLGTPRKVSWPVRTAKQFLDTGLDRRRSRSWGTWMPAAVWGFVPWIVGSHGISLSRRVT